MRTLLAIGIGSLFALTPMASQADAFKPSKTDQVKLGKRAAADIEKKQKIVVATDVRVAKLREIANRILQANPDAKPEPWEFSFNLIENKQVNAFALPGGPIYFYTGLFDKYKTEDQIAGVLAHEIMHVKREHWAYAYADQQKRALGLGILLILLDAGKTATDLASISNDLLLTLPYIRKHETESDDRGFDAMVKAGFNPNGMVDSFKVLMENTKGGKSPEFLSTHPDTAKRIKRLEDKVGKLTQTFAPQKPVPWAKD